MKRLRIILFEHYRLLLEYDRDLTWKQHGGRAMQRVVDSWNDSHPIVQHIRKSGDDEYKKNLLMSTFEAADPTPSKKYAQHIARLYGTRGVDRFEDINARLKPALRDYEDLKNRKILPPEHRDIGRFKSLTDLEDAIEPYKGQTSGRQATKAYHEEMKKPENTTIEDHATFTKYIPHTKESAQHWGRGTRWCTAPDDLENSAFDHYNDNGKLHIIVPKFPKYAGEKYQFHSHSGDEESYTKEFNDTQLMNEKDEYAHKQLKENHPEIHTHLTAYANAAIKDSKTKAGLHHEDGWVRERALTNARLTPKEIEPYLNDESSRIRFMAHDRLPKSNPRPYEHAKKFLSQFKTEDQMIDALERMPAGNSHPGVSMAMMDTNHKNVQYHGAFDPNLPKEYMDRASKTPHLMYSAARNEGNSDENLKKLMKHQDRNISEAAAETYGRRHKINKPARDIAKDIIWHGR